MQAKTKEFLILFSILIFGAIFRLWGLSGLELHSDAAHYAFRALGWFDYLGGTEQTTPIYWFGSIPPWANLSFHDAPPMAFLLQKISFWFFGEKTFAVLLPGALAGLAALVFVYLAVKSALGVAWARFAALLYAISSYAVWSGRVGYLEAVEVAFLAGSFFFFFQYFKTEKKSHLYWWGVFAGLALLTKYTALFLFPAVAVLILWKGRKILKKPDFWLAVFLTVIILSPVIVYNVMVFSTRGHFDAALSSMVGMQPDDFRLIAHRTADANWWTKASGAYGTLLANISQPLFWLYMASLAWLLVSLVWKKADDFSRFLVLNLGFMWVMFGFTGSADRYLSIAAPFLIMVLAVSAHSLWQILARPVWRYFLSGVLAFTLVIEVFYGVQTNLLSKPIWTPLYSYSSIRFYNRGFAELDKFLVQTFKTDQKLLKRPASMQEISELTLRDPRVVFFDTRADWFSSMWHVSRLRFYYNVPVVNFKAGWMTPDGKIADTYEQFKLTGLPYMLLVVAAGDNRVYSGGEAYDKAMENLLARISSANIAPVKIIKDYRGRAGFEIYQLTPTDLK